MTVGDYYNLEDINCISLAYILLAENVYFVSLPDEICA